MRTIPLSILLTVALAACQSATTPTTQGSTATGALTTEAARAAVRRYLRAQSDSALYVLSSAAIL